MDRWTDGQTWWIQYTPPPTSLGRGIIKQTRSHCYVANSIMIFFYNSTKSCSSIAYFLVIQSFWNSAQSTAVILLCSVQNFNMIGQLTLKICTNKTLVYDGSETCTRWRIHCRVTYRNVFFVWKPTLKRNLDANCTLIMANSSLSSLWNTPTTKQIIIYSMQHINGVVSVWYQGINGHSKYGPMHFQSFMS